MHLLIVEGWAFKSTHVVNDTVGLQDQDVPQAPQCSILQRKSGVLGQARCAGWVGVVLNLFLSPAAEAGLCGDVGVGWSMFSRGCPFSDAYPSVVPS